MNTSVGLQTAWTRSVARSDSEAHKVRLRLKEVSCHKPCRKVRSVPDATCRSRSPSYSSDTVLAEESSFGTTVPALATIVGESSYSNTFYASTLCKVGRSPRIHLQERQLRTELINLTFPAPVYLLSTFPQRLVAIPLAIAPGTESLSHMRVNLCESRRTY
jgi:hypothetical protein